MSKASADGGPADEEHPMHRIDEWGSKTARSLKPVRCWGASPNAAM